jgi:L-rhamnose mutarotase
LKTGPADARPVAEAVNKPEAGSKRNRAGGGHIKGGIDADPEVSKSKSAQTKLMNRNAFKMKLKPGYEAEYQKRHDEIWTELSKALADAGVSDYSIFLDEETLTLFAVQKLADAHTADDLPSLPIVRKWWNFMADIMEVNPDNSPVCKPLAEVFHAD